MKNNQLRLRMNDKSMNKLRLYLRLQGKTMTQVIEEVIDSLPEVIVEATEQEKMFIK
ncbi:MAG: hypothetical protein MK289_06690 [Trichodesmium sp. ALOHA_ZT_67]|nr:hypothetical protein [Trichodesmium sp. ALOHA_ZT_67]MDE5095562.1 hypothetical protein [Trichodesmium sp. St11_bin5]